MHPLSPPHLALTVPLAGRPNLPSPGFSLLLEDTNHPIDESVGDDHAADNQLASPPSTRPIRMVRSQTPDLHEEFYGPTSFPDIPSLNANQPAEEESEPFAEPIIFEDEEGSTPEVPHTLTAHYVPVIPPRLELPEPQYRSANEISDFIKQWPSNIPECIANPSKNILLSGYILGSDPDDCPFLERMVQMHILHLSAANVPRNTVEYTLKTLYNVVDTCQKKARQADPDSETLLSDTPAQTLRTLRRQTATNVPMMVYPVCPDMNCQDIPYKLRSSTSFSSGRGVPPNCSVCGQDFSPLTGRIPADFPHITLITELERVLAHPGIETLTFNWKERRRLIEQSDAVNHPGLKIYRDQWSGSHLDTILGPDGNPLISDDNVPVIYVNLFLDWVNRSSSMASSAYSVGHISLQIVNLPQGFRGVQSLIMLVGIIPGEYPRC
jgi:hypothetical protein